MRLSSPASNRIHAAIKLMAPVVMAFSMAASQAIACSCQRDPTAEGLLNSASAVFTGTAEDNRPIGSGRSVTTFTVTETFKGPPRGTVVRVKHRDGPSPTCGVDFTPGEIYTLAAHQAEAAGEFSTSFCSTWMFLPHVGLSKKLIERMREIGPRP